MTGPMTAIIQTIVSAVTSFLQGIGVGIGDFFEDIMVTGTGDNATLSNLGVFIIVLLGLTIGLAVVRSVWSLIGGYRTRA